MFNSKSTPLIYLLAPLNLLGQAKPNLHALQGLCSVKLRHACFRLNHPNEGRINMKAIKGRAHKIKAYGWDPDYLWVPTYGVPLKTKIMEEQNKQVHQQ